ncbi:TadE/TadG family type IV pilus assembly protein [Rhodovulum bhavnagarense]|uniref:TadE/TadG family type IV pilus assembly protein n=1 Tax=Rhodovulum bhavnagarense TaxID=992286 RepID=UPI001404ED74|nr:TadE/TadG family type IV pilus assembly protein [Rhodovulum bhavnagarense]
MLQGQAGTAAVEFALVLAPFLILCFGVFEVGRAVSISSDLGRLSDIAMREFYLGNLGAADDDATVEAALTPLLQAAFTGPGPDGLTVNCTTGSDTRVLELSYSFGFISRLFDGAPGIPLSAVRSLPLP